MKNRLLQIAAAFLARLARGVPAGAGAVRGLLQIAALGVVLHFAAPARAQVIAEPAPPAFPDPKKFAHGFYAEGDVGAVVFLGRAGRYAAPGPVFGARIGYDFTRWLAVQAHVAGASNDANLPPPTVGQTFQTYEFAGEARFAIPIQRFQIFAQGGAGVAVLSTNVLDSVGVTHGGHATLIIVGGGGLDYHTLNRHFSVGLGGDYAWLANFTNAHALEITAYLKYTH